MKYIFLLSLLFFQPEPLKVKKVSKTISMPMPAALRPMTEHEIIQQSPSVRKQLAAYTTDDRLADFTISTSATQWKASDRELAKKFFQASIKNLYDWVSFSKEDIVEINQRTYIRFEFESKISGMKFNEGQKEPVFQYHYMQYLVENNRTLVFSFHCLRSMRAEWESNVSQMMNGIKLK